MAPRVTDGVGTAGTLGEVKYIFSLAKHGQHTAAPASARKRFVEITVNSYNFKSYSGARIRPGSAEYMSGADASLASLDIKVYLPLPGGIRIIAGAGTGFGGGAGVMGKTLADQRGYSTEGTVWASYLLRASFTLGVQVDYKKWREWNNDARTVMNWAKGPLRRLLGTTPSGPAPPSH